MKGFVDKRDEKHVYQNNPSGTAKKYLRKRRSKSLFIYHFTVGEPFARCTVEDEFEDGIVDKKCTKKEPTKVEKWITIELHIQVPAVITKDTNDGN